MSVRKITELPYVDVTESSVADKVNASKIEIAYCEKLDSPFIFTSKHIRVDDFVNMILDTLNGNQSQQSQTDMYNKVVFHQKAFFLAGESLSGDVHVNSGVNVGRLANYKMVLNSGRVDINSYSQNRLSATNNFVYGNLYSKTKDSQANIFSATETAMNVYQPMTVRSTLQVNQNATFSANLQVNGTATFSNPINGVALQARWADLAEYYESDREYAPGTLVKFGGEKEITVSDGEVNAVVTSKPGLVLNSSKPEGEKVMLGIALIGRTGVLVDGAVRKFDRISHFKDGIGMSIGRTSEGSVVGIALEDKKTTGVGIVECVVKLTF